MPVYLFALGVSPNFDESQIAWTFFIIHFLLYPASNGYNSYFDKDEKSIGGLKNPPPVNRSLYYTSLALDALAIGLAWVKISFLLAVMIFIFGVVSKAYSHPSIRLKKYPIIGWLTVGLFQGFFSFLMSYVGINHFGIENLMHTKILMPAMLASIMLLGSYPMTQIYQHEEDAKHGDQTLSMMLGIRGTFIFVQIVFVFAVLGFVLYFNSFYSGEYSAEFVLAFSPAALFFIRWLLRAWNNSAEANFSNTMWLNFISSFCLNGFFVYFFLANTHVWQYL
jgi:1,4-dihydroxy-2-naphthoate octaprenyltransferase